MRVVIDTNVLVSGILKPRSKPARIIALMRERKILPIVNADTLGELVRVLRYPKLRALHTLTDAEINEFVFLYAQIGVLLPQDSATISGVVRDPGDDMYIAAALAGNAAVIISGDDDLCALGSYGTIPILSPARFLDQFDAETT
jgi:putative PIN family toxin of toxin-antitoxin system